MHPDWARDLRDRCGAAGIPFFFKQWGAWAPERPGMGSARYQDVSPAGETVGLGAYPGIVRMRRVGKQAAGRVLDGRTWDQTPQLPVPAGGPGGHGGECR
jgi:protein gp37